MAFSCLGVAGAQRLNDYIHECLPKTYLAKGKLGIETPTGDLTVEVSQEDSSEYLQQVISQFESDFIEQRLQERFLGTYFQAPHKFSAAKYQGKALHKWAREGVEIKKEKQKRKVYQLEVVKYEFPDLWIRFTVSSGTYIRTLFSDCAKELGTIGTLSELIREKVGGCLSKDAIQMDAWNDSIPFLPVDDILQFSSLFFEEKEAKLYSNGVRLNFDRVHSQKSDLLAEFPYFWVRDKVGNILGLAKIEDNKVTSLVNF